MWLLVGIVLSDLVTICIGSQLRRNLAVLRSQAPQFGGRLLKSVGAQLSVEARRDVKRLERQLERRLQATARTASELLASLSSALLPADVPGQRPEPPPPPPLPTALRLQLVRRLTCNTRSALAASGQAGPRILRKLTATSAGRVGTLDLPYMRTRLASPAVPSLAERLLGVGSGDDDRERRARSSFAAGVDNRVGLGQRWPLALLSGLDRPIDYRSYAAGSALAALTLTLPIELLLGAALRAYPAAIRLMGAAIATAQLCRFGPLWYAVGRAVFEEVCQQLRVAKAKGDRST